ncbi:unnamed protein product, partial [Rotaria sp. Silwood1]
IPANNSCEPIRFYLGIVCFSTWILMLVGPPKPSLPTRRSFILECIILVLSTSFLSTYLGFVASAMNKTQESECTYTRIEDLYFGAPLKSFAYVGIILAGCTIGINILGTIINQFFLRLPSLRRVFIYLLAIHYAISYLIVVVFVYYFSVGAILLYQPRSGGSCRVVAPNLYKTLLIWQSIRVFLPLLILSFALLAVCLGVVCGACLAACLPASITVPLLEMLRVGFVLKIRNSTMIPSIQARLPDTPGAINPNPPASPDTIDALPMVVFGQVADEFNQTECTICRADYEANERLKILPCGHLFHARCVAHWLSITRICPVCRQRITSANL